MLNGENIQKNGVKKTNIMKIKSDSLIINKPARKIYNFLSDFNNFEHLMPEQVTNWKSTEITCSFTVQNMADVKMRIHEKEVDSHVHVVSESKSPFGFELKCKLEPVEEEKTKVHIEAEADVNPMMKMMIQRPVQNLVNIMVEKLKHHHEKNN